ncbi:hypothetical protein EV363DRAFT_1084217, partial [Boletus edulis]
LEDHSIFSFLIDTYEENIPRNEKIVHNIEEGSSQQPARKKAGRVANTRSSYLPDHPKHLTHRRVVRTPGHSALPNIIGPFFPNAKDESTEDLYCASMLTLLRPWRKLEDIKGHQDSFRNAFNQFMKKATPTDRDIICGIQYYYDCRNAA